MNRFRVFILYFATLVGFARSEFVVCNASPGLVSSQGNTVACYTSVNGGTREYKCPWGRCNAATATGCQINSHQWKPDVEFTCDKDYSLPVGNDVKIICDANKSWKTKCDRKSGPDCPHNSETSYEAECNIITNHSRCHGCVPA
ncbi:uncharacterized protein MELLADRAFT_124112 [Melampsora larici-populina 98AG31]|uniref:Secreted protein n=1 Tax=Melampsora larici-populina (strain 98AG31 / pathotype 3-4-7) TaxID=747676 RepID=F4RE92_MELLP|nr:uncharacterized protein MELLADRAFT_124112 [Melampsora larici-populina 98AG31]EGG09312.1 secreted protein [Melampsora larici-populina 98AG31]